MVARAPEEGWRRQRMAGEAEEGEKRRLRGGHP